MEYPYGHHGHHHHHHRRGEEGEEEQGRERWEMRQEEEQQYYPPPGHPRPDPSYTRVEERYESSEHYRPPPPPRYGRQGGVDYHGEDIYGHAPPPPVQHVGHAVGQGPYGSSGYGSGGGGRRMTVRVFTKAAEEYSLTVRDGQVVLAPSDPSDDYQHWIKDEKYAVKVKDEEGLPCFALVNKVTGEAIKHSIGATHPVRLVPYNPDYLDESVLWTESYDTGEDFRCIRMVNNIRLNFDAFHGDKDHGGVRDGTTIVLWEWLKGENQRWKIVPYCK